MMLHQGDNNSSLCLCTGELKQFNVKIFENKCCRCKEGSQQLRNKENYPLINTVNPSITVLKVAERS